MSLLQDVTESEIPEDVDKPCGILSKVSRIKLFRRTPLPAGGIFMPLLRYKFSPQGKGDINRITLMKLNMKR